MARLNAGSELHLLRMLGRHRDYLNRKVCESTQAEHVEWLDFPSGEKRRDKQGNILWDREWHQLHSCHQMTWRRRPGRQLGRRAGRAIVGMQSVAFDSAWPTSGCLSKRRPTLRRCCRRAKQPMEQAALRSNVLSTRRKPSLAERQTAIGPSPVVNSATGSWLCTSSTRRLGCSTSISTAMLAINAGPARTPRTIGERYWRDGSACGAPKP